MCVWAEFYQRKNIIEMIQNSMDWYQFQQQRKRNITTVINKKEYSSSQKLYCNLSSYKKGWRLQGLVVINGRIFLSKKFYCFIFCWWLAVWQKKCCNPIEKKNLHGWKIKGQTFKKSFFCFNILGPIYDLYEVVLFFYSNGFLWLIGQVVLLSNFSHKLARKFIECLNWSYNMMNILYKHICIS